MDLLDKVVLITGGRRIGSAVAEGLSRHGADVSLSYRLSADAAEDAAAAVRSHGRRALVNQADLTDPQACRHLIADTCRELGQLNVLIHMASSYVRRPFDDLTAADLDGAIAVDVRGAYLCALAAVPHLRAAGGGHIITFSDWVAQSGRPRYAGFLPYYVAQKAVIGLTEALALELAKDRILVNAIAPGPICPPDEMEDTAVEKVAEATPLGRWGGNDEIVKAVTALLASDFTTGETIRVDGGRHLR
jgi:NAD(P)-dependent dehydrogenase (short-subunit alcohol dehydrogenase family)